MQPNTSKTRLFIGVLILVICAIGFFYLGYSTRHASYEKKAQTLGNTPSSVSASKTDPIADTISLPDKTHIDVYPKIDQWSGDTVRIVAKKKLHENLPKYAATPGYLVFDIRCDMEKSTCAVGSTIFEMYTETASPEIVADGKIHAFSEHRDVKISEADQIDLKDPENPKGNFKIGLGGEFSDYMTVDLTNESVEVCLDCTIGAQVEKL